MRPPLHARPRDGRTETNRERASIEALSVRFGGRLAPSRALNHGFLLLTLFALPSV